MKFKVGANKKIDFGYGPGGVGAEHYKDTVGHYHTGVDYRNGYGSPVYSDNYGWVYKINTTEQSPSGWAGVYYICPDEKEGFVEVCQGHLSEIYVKVGDVVREGQMIGREGNKGEVYSGGTRITKEMQMAGDKRGSHVHEQFRPVRRVSKPSQGKHYLNGESKHGYTDKDGRYRDKKGMYYEIKYQDNGTKGCINPYTYLTEKKSLLPGVVNKILSFVGL
jgi:murein DD-endopeptidase MepM/ murein hydrolase activator NlpD